MSVDGSNSNGNYDDNGIIINDSRVNNIISGDSNDIGIVINNDRVSIVNNIIGSDNVAISNKDNLNLFNVDLNFNFNGGGLNLGGIFFVLNFDVNYYGSVVFVIFLSDFFVDFEMFVVFGV